MGLLGYSAGDFGITRKPMYNKRRSKYGAIKTLCDNHWFDSKLEATRYQELRLLEKAGKIWDLHLQVKFPIIVDEIKICTYIADFVYYKDKKCCPVIEDAKGRRLSTFNLKWKLMKALYSDRYNFALWPEKKRAPRKRGPKLRALRK